MLFQVNQIGTVTKSIQAALNSKDVGWGVMVSHQSGETEDNFIADLLVPDGAAITGQHSETKINFTALNERCLPVVGFYGDKRMMVEIFQNKGLIKDVVLSNLQDGKFESGLYVQVLEKMLVIFYWHECEHLKNASRKDVSCNFIRYLVELCDSIHCTKKQRHTDPTTYNCIYEPKWPSLLTGARNSDKNTPLHEAAKKGNQEVVRILLKHNKYVVHRHNQFGETPLIIDSEHGHVDSAKLLLLLAATPLFLVFWPRENRQTCLNAAAYGGHL
ncbi:hypothetical protein KI387_032699, partial [Taxus chinensis]